MDGWMDLILREHFKWSKAMRYFPEYLPNLSIASDTKCMSVIRKMMIKLLSLINTHVSQLLSSQARFYRKTLADENVSWRSCYVFTPDFVRISPTFSNPMQQSVTRAEGNIRQKTQDICWGYDYVQCNSRVSRFIQVDPLSQCQGLTKRGGGGRGGERRDLGLCLTSVSLWDLQPSFRCATCTEGSVTFFSHFPWNTFISLETASSSLVTPKCWNTRK